MARSIERGINIHSIAWGNATNPYQWNNIPTIIDAVKRLGYTALRVEYANSSNNTSSPDPLTRMQIIMGLCRDRGIKVQPTILFPYNVSPTDYGTYPNTPVGRYNQGFNITRTLLQAVPYPIEELEIENEVSPKTGMLWYQGLDLSEYNTPAFDGLADVMKGSYDAIRMYSPTTRIIVGVTNSNYAFIPFMQSKGIDPDIVGHHIYFRDTGNEETLKTWQNGPDWHKEMLKYGKPITINETNGNANRLTQAQTAIWGAKVIEEIMSSPVPVESIYTYELLDTPYEAGFGVATLSGTHIQDKADFTKFVQTTIRNKPQSRSDVLWI